MFGNKDKNPSPGRIDSLIGAGTSIEGTVRFNGGLRIEGEVKGAVEAVAGSVSTLVVCDQARIEGNVQVSHLVLNGTICGPVKVDDALEMQPKARIIGDVSYASIEMHQGAVIEGHLIHTRSAVEPNAAVTDQD
jgi:cytoskeletal protein CcmA (bactofilin family)